MSNTQQEDARGPDQRGGGGHLRLLTPERTVPGPGYLEDRHMARTFHMNRLERMNNALLPYADPDWGSTGRRFALTVTGRRSGRPAT